VDKNNAREFLLEKWGNLKKIFRKFWELKRNKNNLTKIKRSGKEDSSDGELVHTSQKYHCATQ